MDLDNLCYDAVDLLKELIRRPSFSKKETRAANFLEKYLKARGLVPQRKGNNIWLLSPDWDDNLPIVLLNSHIDTVRPSSGWTRDPFTPGIENGKLYGLGSNDAGASLVSLLQAFLVLSERKRESNFIFLVSCEEEISGKGGIESVLPLLPAISWGMVGEPTEMQPAIAEKGLLVIDGVIKGKAGHVAHGDGENAIYRALPVIDWFRQKQFSDVGAMSGAVQMSVTMVQSGFQHNVVPDEFRFTVDVRTNECYTNKEIFDEIAASCGCEVKARSLRLAPSHIAIEHPIVKRAVSLGLLPFASSTLSDQALMNFPSLKIGPGVSKRSHTADEFVLLSEIRNGIEIYVKLLT